MPHDTRHPAPSQESFPFAEDPCPTAPATPSAWGSWRPLGWRGVASPEDVGPAAAALKGKHRRQEALSERELDTLHNEALLRDCYVTPAAVWQLATDLACLCLTDLSVDQEMTESFSWDCDPFSNPSAQGHAAQARVKLDGTSEDRDGLDFTEEGRPANWVGNCLVNGPHSKPATWLSLCDMHGQHNVVAAVCPLDGTQWYHRHAAQADVMVSLGRLNYEAPPGLPPRFASPRGSSLLLWIPRLRQAIWEGKFPSHYRQINLGKKEPSIVVVTPGLAGRTLIGAS